MLTNDQKAAKFNDGKDILTALTHLTYPSNAFRMAFIKAIETLVTDANDSAYVPQTDVGAHNYDLLNAIIQDISIKDPLSSLPNSESPLSDSDSDSDEVEDDEPDFTVTENDEEEEWLDDDDDDTR